MKPSRRKSRRHALDSSKQMEVRVVRASSAEENAESPPKECSAKVVDVSTNGFKLVTSEPFGFQEKIIVDFPVDDEQFISATAEVRWVEPKKEGKNWFAGCLLAEAFPAEYIDDMAQKGVLDRRRSVRHSTNQTAVGRWEMTQEDIPVQIKDVSASGVRLFIETEPDLEKRIRIHMNNRVAITARSLWKRPVDGGFLVGCEVTEGSPFSLMEMTLASALHGAQTRISRYQVLSFCGLSLFLVMLIREWFF